MLAGLRPGQRRVVLRVPGLADVDDHVPQDRPFAGALDEILLEEVMGRCLHFRSRHLFRAIAGDEAPLHQVLGAFRIDELEGVNAEEGGLIVVRRRGVVARQLRQTQRVGMGRGIGF